MSHNNGYNSFYEEEPQDDRPIEEKYPKTNRVKIIGTGIFEGEVGYGYIVDADTQHYLVAVEVDGIELRQKYSRNTGIRPEREDTFKNAMRLDLSSVNPHFNIGIEAQIKKNEAQRDRRQLREQKWKKEQSSGKRIRIIILKQPDSEEIYNSVFDTPREARKFLRRNKLSSKDAERSDDKLTWTLKVWSFKKELTPDSED